MLLISLYITVSVQFVKYDKWVSKVTDYVG